MLIKLDKSLEQTLSDINKSFNEDSLEVKALNNLAIAFRNGWHIIIGPLHVLRFIRDLEYIDNSTKSVFDRLINEYTFQKSYMDLVDEYILVKGLNGYPNKIENEESDYYETPLNYFSDLNKCLHTSLLCEDASDYDFYIKLGKKYIKENREISGIDLAFNFANGGGINSYRVLEMGIINMGNPVLAIADSDKKYPCSSNGQTLKQLLKIENQYKNKSILRVYPLPVREKENLIPPSLYLIGCEHTYKSQLEKLLLIEKEYSEKLLYFNIKDGYKVKHFKDERFYEYYRNVFTEVEDLIACSIDDLDVKKDENEVVVNGLNSIVEQFTYSFLDNGIEERLQKKRGLQNPTPQVLNIIKELEETLELKGDLFNNLPEYIRDIIIELCQKMLSWGCSKGMTYGTLGA